MKMFSLESLFVPQVRLKEKLQHEMFPSKNEVTCTVSDTNIFVVMSKSDWFCSVQLCWSCINFRFSIADIFHGIISFWEKTTVPSLKHLSQCSVNIICAISLLFLIQSRQQLKVKWFPISWNTFSFNITMKKHRDSNIKCLQRVFFLWWVDSG